MSLTMIPVRVRHNLKCFYLGVYMFNDHPFPDQPLVVRFLSFSQLMILACLFRCQGYSREASLSPDTPSPRLSHMEEAPAFPIISLYTLKSCILPFHYLTSMISRVFRLIIALLNKSNIFTTNFSPNCI
jgi:hypothetical protein